MVNHEALERVFALISSNLGWDLCDWESSDKLELQSVRDALQPESDVICEHGTWSVVRMDSFHSLFVDAYRCES
jgi:hypothetical protein